MAKAGSALADYVGMLLGLCRSCGWGFVLGLTPSEENAVVKAGGALTQCRALGSTSFPSTKGGGGSCPSGWGCPGTASLLGLSCFGWGWCRNPKLPCVCHSDEVQHFFFFFFHLKWKFWSIYSCVFVISEVSQRGTERSFQPTKTHWRRHLEIRAACPITTKKPSFISYPINAVLWPALANKVCATWH